MSKPAGGPVGVQRKGSQRVRRRLQAVNKFDTAPFKRYEIPEPEDFIRYKQKHGLCWYPNCEREVEDNDVVCNRHRDWIERNWGRRRNNNGN